MGYKQGRPLDHNGNPMKYEISTFRLSLALRAIDETELRRLHPLHGRDELAHHFNVQNHDIQGVEEYYGLPSRAGRVASKDAKRIDVLAERLWQIMEPRVRDIIREPKPPMPSGDLLQGNSANWPI